MEIMFNPAIIIVALALALLFLAAAAYFITGAVLRAISDYNKRHKEKQDGKRKKVGRYT